MKTIAIVAQNGMKTELPPLLKKYSFDGFNIISTEGTAKFLNEHSDIIISRTVPSGKDGGDLIISNMVLNGEIDIIVLLLNPMVIFPHFWDASALVRVCNLKNVPLAINIKTADILFFHSIEHSV